MIEANELRIGNLIKPCNNNYWSEWYLNKVRTTGVRCTIETLLDKDEYWNWEYIPLTEEWLFKFGLLEVKKGKKYTVSAGIANLYITENGKKYNYAVYEKPFFIQKIKYVHQLQNLYFALTGQELQIKENEPRTNK